MTSFSKDDVVWVFSYDVLHPKIAGTALNKAKVIAIDVNNEFAFVSVKDATIHTVLVANLVRDKPKRLHQQFQTFKNGDLVEYRTGKTDPKTHMFSWHTSTGLVVQGNESQKKQMITIQCTDMTFRKEFAMSLLLLSRPES
jgi:hypothetical protein